MHKLVIDGLDDFEAEHIASVLRDYEGTFLAQMVEALAAGEKERMQWLDEHIKWHREVMKKVVWTKS